MKTENEFDKKYSGDKNYNYDNQEGQDGMMETFSPHVERVIDLNNTNPKKIWTIMNATSFDGLIIAAGMRYVNRFMYFVTNEEWDDKDDEYIWWESEDDDNEN